MSKLVIIFLFTLSSCSLLDLNPIRQDSMPATTSTIIKSPNDTRDYLSLTLPNQLEVIVISDPETDKAAASLDVNIGSSDDPNDFEGLAHFLEHMLFLGTEKYPEPDEYQKYISDHGGMNNAYTSLENTNYFFDVQSEHLLGALDRFSEQFTHPLFNEEYVEREANAVHSEFTSKIKDDGRRMFSVIKANLSKDHPYSKFSVGNLETLRDKEKTKLREALLSFYQKNYSANQMKLVVIGKEPVETLASWVTQKFSEIPNNNSTPTEIDQNFFSEGFLPARLEIQSIKDTRSLSIAFPIPSASEHSSSQPVIYLSNLIGHEGKGSLLSTLKAEGLVDTLSAGGQFDTDKNAILMINLSLTEKGLVSEQRILQVIFSYLKLLKETGIQKVYFDERAKMLATSFDFQEKAEPIHYVGAISSALKDTKAREVLFKNYNLHDYNPELYAEYLSFLRPENMLLTLSAKSVDGKLKTQWYDAPYSVSHLSSKYLQSLALDKIVQGLALPLPNIFIPENTTLIDHDIDLRPERLKGFESFDLWYAADPSFGTPKSTLFATIRSSHPNSSAQNLNLSELFVSMLRDALNEFSYPAYLAGLNYELYNHTRGITIKISGYNDKQGLMLNKIIETLKFNKFSEERFTIIKERLKRKLENAKDDKPFRQAIARAQQTLIIPSWSENQRLKELDSLTVDDLSTFRSVFLSQLDLAILSTGNVTKETTLEIAEQIDNALLHDATRKKISRSQVAKLSGSQNLYDQVKVDHPDTGFVYYLQSPDKSFKSRALTALTSQILSTEYYAQIRTDKQLGYIVFATNFSILNVPAMAFIVQSPTVDGKTLHEETVLFLEQQRSEIMGISAEKLSQYKAAVVSKLLKRDNTLYERSNRYWSEIDDENFDFNTKQKLAEQVGALTSEDLNSFYNILLDSTGNVLMIDTVSNDKEEAGKTPPTFSKLTIDSNIELKTFD